MFVFSLHYESLFPRKFFKFLIRTFVKFAVKRATVTSGMNLPDEDPEERRLNQEIAKWEEKLRELFGEGLIFRKGIEVHFF